MSTRKPPKNAYKIGNLSYVHLHILPMHTLLKLNLILLMFLLQ